MPCNFTFKHYEEIIQKALECEYVFYTFNEYIDKKPKGNAMLMRHDIDNHLYRTADFARIENTKKVKATYFFRVHAPYNIFEFNNYKLIKSLEKTGHEIGIHTEIGDFEKFNPSEDYLQLLKREKEFMEACLGHKITGFSSHRDFDYQVNPLPIINNLDYRSIGFKYFAYQDEFHKDAKYISEVVSGHITWREGCPCTFIGKNEKICLLTHPAWWYNEHPREGETYENSVC